MTQDEIISMAREAGFIVYDNVNIPLYTTPPSVEAAIEATKAEYERKFDAVFGELIEKIKGGMSAESAIRSLK